MDVTSIDLAINFIEKPIEGSLVSSSAATTPTYDVIPFCFIGLLLISILLVALWTLKKFGNFHKLKLKFNHLSISKSNKFFATIINTKLFNLIFIIIISLFIFLFSFTIFRANAEENQPWASSTVNAYLNDNGSITFDEAWLQNVSSEDMSIRYVSVLKTKEVEDIEFLDLSHISITADKGLFFHGNPVDAEDDNNWFPVDLNCGKLASQEITDLHFSLTNMSCFDFQSLIGKNVFIVKVILWPQFSDITFNAGDGQFNDGSKQKTINHQDLTLPLLFPENNPEYKKEDYFFEGWYTKPNGEGKQYNTEDVLRDELTKTLFAYYKKRNVYKITLNADDGNNDCKYIYEKYDVGFFKDSKCSQVISEIPEDELPKKDYHDFHGYFSNEKQCIINDKGKFLVNANFFVADAVLTAAWDAQIFQITLDNDGGYGGINLIYEKYSCGFFADEDCKQKLTYFPYSYLPQKSHYTYDGYYLNDKLCVNDEGNFLVNSDYFISNSTIKASWDANVYKISLNNNHGDSYLNAIYEKYNESFYYDFDCSEEITDRTIDSHLLPERSGYSFNGYRQLYSEAINIDSSGKILIDPDAYDVNITNYATWSGEVYNIDLRPNGADKPRQITTIYEKFNNGFYNKDECKHEDWIEKVDKPIKYNFQFLGYFDSDNIKCIDENGNIIIDYKHFSKNSILTAKWCPEIYKIQLNPESMQSEGYCIYEKYDDGFYKDLKCENKIDHIDIPQKDNYNFLGYKDKGVTYIDNTGKIIVDAKEFTNDSELIASWDAKVYKIAINKSGENSFDYIYEKYNIGFYSDEKCSAKVDNIDIESREHYVFMGYYWGDLKITDTFGNISCRNTTFKDDVRDSNPVVSTWDAKIYSILLIDNNNDITRTIWEKYNTGFYLDKDCTMIIDKNNPVIVPLKDYYNFNGYFLDSEQIIDEHGCVASGCTPNTITIDETPLSAKWDAKVYRITLNTTDVDATKCIYEKYGCGFYLDEACTQNIYTKDVPSDFYVILPKPVQGEDCIGYSNSQELVVKLYQGYKGIMNCDTTLFVTNTTINPVYLDTIIKINLIDDKDEQNIYEHYGFGFYSDPECKTEITRVNVPPIREHYSFTGYGYTPQSESVINEFGKLPEPTTFYTDCTLQAKWIGKVYEITLQQENVDITGTEKIYQRYGDNFYFDGDCKNVATNVNLPQKRQWKCYGYSYEEPSNKVIKVIDENGHILQKPDYFKDNSNIAAVFQKNVFSIKLMVDEEVNLTIYEKFNEGFFANQDCSEQIEWPIKIPKKEGLYFLGYYGTDQTSAAYKYIDDKGLPTKQLESTTFSEDTYLYAHWEERIINITFNTVYVIDKDYTKNLYVRYNDNIYWDEKCSQPFNGNINVPFKDNYTFGGYYNEQFQIFNEKGEKSQYFDALYFTEDTTLVAKWDANVYTINLCFDEDDQLSEEVSRVFYEKFGDGFYDDYECTQRHTYKDAFNLPIYINRICLGYYDGLAPNSRMLISKDGFLCPPINYEYFINDATIYAKIDFEVHEISFSDELTKSGSVPDPIYVKQYNGFYTDKDCTPGKEIDKLSASPKYIDETKLFSGYYLGDVKIIGGQDSMLQSNVNKILVDSNFFDEDVVLKPHFDDFICGTITKDSGTYGRTDTGIDNQTISIQLFRQDMLDTKIDEIEIQKIDTYTGYWYYKFENGWINCDYIVKFNDDGYGAVYKDTGSHASIQLIATLNLDNYDLDDLEIASNSIAVDKQHSKYYNEFLGYVKNDVVWYSHSCGLFDINHIEETAYYLDRRYINFFDFGKDEKYNSEVNKYLFLRIIGINHDCAIDPDTNEEFVSGLTLQAIKCLPNTYIFDYNKVDWVNDGWDTSYLRSILNDGNNSVYSKLCEPLQRLVNNTKKTTMNQDLDKVTTYDNLFVLSYQELTTAGTCLEKFEKFKDGTEGTQYEWYQHYNIVGNDSNEKLNDQGFTNSGYSIDAGVPDWRWLRSPFGFLDRSLYANKYINDYGEYFCGKEIDNEYVSVNPAFSIGKTNNENKNIKGELSFKDIDTEDDEIPYYLRMEDKSINFVCKKANGEVFEGKAKLLDYNFSTYSYSFILEGFSESWKTSTFNIKLNININGIFAEGEFNDAFVGQDEILKLKAQHGIDNYALEELNYIHKYIKEDKHDYSGYKREFESYLKNGDVWYSHSCGKFNPDSPDETKQFLDNKYKNNFKTDSDNASKDELNQFLFLRLIGIEHDTKCNQNENKASFTFQVIHRLPKLYAYDSSNNKTNSILWSNSTIRYDLNAGEIYQGLNDEFKKYLCSVDKYSQKEKTPTKNQEVSNDKLFLLSYKEMYTPGTEYEDSKGNRRDDWYYDNTEGEQYQWYCNNNIDGSSGFDVWENNEVLQPMCQLNNEKSKVRLWERTIGKHTSQYDNNKFLYINPDDDEGCTIYSDNINCEEKYGICPCFCIGGGSVPEPEHQINVNIKVTKDAGNTGRADVYNLKDMPVTYKYEISPGHIVTYTDFTDRYGNCKLSNLPDGAKELDLDIYCAPGKGYYAQTSLKVSSGESYYVELVDKLNIDNYTFSELNEVSSHIRNNGTASIYWNEFNNYLKNGDIWYSHSYGRYNPTTPDDITCLDKQYKCAFSNPSHAPISDVNNYLFLRLISVNYKYDKDNYAGLIFQTVHCLPVLYPLHSNNETAPNEVFWPNSTLDSNLVSGSIYDALSNNIKDVLSSNISWLVDVDRSTLPDPFKQVSRISRNIIIPSCSEMAKMHTLDQDKFGIWNYNSLEGNRFSWYANHALFEEQQFQNEEFYKISVCNDLKKIDIGNSKDEDNTILWTRSPAPMPDVKEGDWPQFVGIKFFDNNYIQLQEKCSSNTKALVAPIFVL